MPIEVIQRVADCRDALRAYDDNSIDALVTDPPAGISFMGKDWDSGTGFVAFLTEVFTLAHTKMKPGAHGLVWALPRTSHWTATALENAGFEIRDEITHIFGSGFPKNYDVAKGIEAKITTGSANWNGFRNLPGEHGAPEAGLGGYSKGATEAGYRPETYTTGGTLKLAPTTDLAARYAGFGTALKPAKENWILIKKPHKRSVAENVILHGTGAINIDGTRVGEGTGKLTKYKVNDIRNDAYGRNLKRPQIEVEHIDKGRWPTNLLFSHSLECGPLACADDCPVAELNRQSGELKSGKPGGPPDRRVTNDFTYGKGISGRSDVNNAYGDSGGASRFFPVFELSENDKLAIFGYFAKPSKAEKNAGLDDLADRPRVFNGQSAAGSKVVADGSVEDKFSTAPAKNHHPTVKSTGLMSWLITLVAPPAPPDGPPPLIVDLFAGSGSGGVAAVQLGRVRWHGYDLDPEYTEIAQRRIDFARLPTEVQQKKRGQFFIDWTLYSDND